MIFQYPFKRILSALALLLIITASAYSQDGTYAKVSASSVHNRVDHQKKSHAEIKICGRSANKILLTWAPFQGAVSHYVLERSTNGRVYEEAAVLFTAAGEEETDYFYADKFRKPFSGLVYYRLRVVGLDGSEVYTLPSLSDPI